MLSMLPIFVPMLMAAVPTAPPPAAPTPAPRITSVRTPPPVFNPVPDAQGPDRQPPVPVRVSLYLGKVTLWSGTLTVGAAPARLSLNEAADLPADCDPPGYRSTNRVIEVTLSRQNFRNQDGFAINARYSRPGQDGLCPVGTRQVSIEQMLTLSSGSVTIEGDGGFRVILQR
ncbi:hypothetical protein [Sphingobium sp.]|uniref:hypothetical protein n=1 Tax=Sphingobium sp. TaxID=1912891 RepID=UPI003B3B7B06